MTMNWILHNLMKKCIKFKKFLSISKIGCKRLPFDRNFFCSYQENSKLMMLIWKCKKKCCIDLFYSALIKYSIRMLQNFQNFLFFFGWKHKSFIIAAILNSIKST